MVARGGSSSAQASASLIPALTREGYYAIPSLERLAKMPASQLRAVRGFRVGRTGYGEITWLGETDVTGVDLDSIVNIEHGDVTMYSNAEHGSKPSVGTKLNKPALIVLERVHVPKSMSTEEFTAALGKSLHGAGASSVEYDPSDGALEFTVPHF